MHKNCMSKLSRHLLWISHVLYSPLCWSANDCQVHVHRHRQQLQARGWHGGWKGAARHPCRSSSPSCPSFTSGAKCGPGGGLSFRGEGPSKGGLTPAFFHSCGIFSSSWELHLSFWETSPTSWCESTSWVLRSWLLCRWASSPELQGSRWLGTDSRANCLGNSEVTFFVFVYNSYSIPK